ncbi:SAM-dependent methyltransferase [Streptomyces sp. NPDC003247]|uniref:SAM-dependent methyltransferase n=1 Tax=Streptomyces sp. NPDC003247 TaxID=3364677 RepID=UPI0036AD64B9
MTHDTHGPGFEIDTSKPHPARMYDYYLGGKDNYPVDAEAAERVLQGLPHGRGPALANRAFMHRAVRFLAEEGGVRQFLDIGTGIPTSPNLHEVAQSTDPAARVVYVDNDPIVLAHAQALLRSAPEGSTDYVQADARDPDAILEAAARTLDLSRPVGLSLIALLHFLPDDHAYDSVTRLLAALAPGSYLVLSHTTADFDPESTARALQVYRDRGVFLTVRSHAEISRFFTGLELIDPGLVPGVQWRPAPSPTPPTTGPTDLFYAGVARKP